MEDDIRWQQRFSNFNKAFLKLSQAVTQAKEKKMSELETEGLIQRFEYTYELAWKTLQDYIKDIGISDINGPSKVLQEALKMELITDSAGWVKLKKSREKTSHTYNPETAEEIKDLILDQFYQLFVDLQAKLESERSGNQGLLGL
ncbi:nucleotidyltransferase substrate binding protein [Algoriphagus persicinus]|uniref:nucleotidyltransferase substrate binding protein n=1 Tax=Algoriphagus persicinus TaxID=3108754 RepID=UPI002B389587|nr:nucleotidyltransferase substrate binding protein [Algoriphagus sp. E1-3-M2]MEB2784426.1 nucleotidyltransferase substrate binding protein [Algoriphagus sp. E1-3-M2]